VPLSAISERQRKDRIQTGSPEIDRVLGGGLVPGGVTLIGGSPGVGKSTLLLQVAALLCRAKKSGAVVGPEGAMSYADFFTRKGGQRGLRAAVAGRAKTKAHASSDAAQTASESDSDAAPVPSTASVSGAVPVVAYISGEESAGQIRSRARRLGLDCEDRLLVMNETRVEDVLAQLDELLLALDSSLDSSSGGSGGSGASGASGASKAGARLSCVIVDSIQTVFTDAAPSSATGTITQVRESAIRLTQWGKANNVPVFLVGHVNKAGDLAGPRALEHLVDTVIYVESEESTASSDGPGSASSSSSSLSSSSSFRMIRCAKNRFGSTSEVGLLEMGDEGFTELDPASLLLSTTGALHPEDGDDKASSGGSGRTVTVTVEGSRPICLEVQALAVPTSFPYPRQRSTGLSTDRAAMLLAVLARHTQIRGVLRCDVLLNVVGGLRIGDTATDLAFIVSIASSVTSTPISPRTVFLGEVGLGGEVRPTPRLGQRLTAAAKLGFTHAVVPAGSQLPPHFGQSKDVPVPAITFVRTVSHAVAVALSGASPSPSRSGPRGQAAGFDAAEDVDPEDRAVAAVHVSPSAARRPPSSMRQAPKPYFAKFLSKAGAVTESAPTNKGLEGADPLFARMDFDADAAFAEVSGAVAPESK
jgi:DNA repair protein RadA/Sms